MAEPLDFQKKSSLERRCNKSVGFYALFGVVGGVCGVEKGYAFWSASVDFHALFGLVGGVCGAEKGHAFWSKSVDFYALFGLPGGGRGVEKGQEVVLSHPSDFGVREGQKASKRTLVEVSFWGCSQGPKSLKKDTC